MQGKPRHGSRQLQRSSRLAGAALVAAPKKLWQGLDYDKVPGLSCEDHAYSIVQY